MSPQNRCRSFLLVVGLVLLCASCGSTGSQENNTGQQTPAQAEHRPLLTAPDGLTGLPADRLQPWETTDEQGNVVRTDPRSSSQALNTDNLQHAVDLFRQSASGMEVIDQTLRIEADGSSGWVMYRIPLGGQQPAVVNIHANLRLDSSGSPSRYSLAVSNYATGRWDWYGAFTRGESHLQLPAGDYTSSFGNLFVTLLVEDGNSIDLAAVSVSEAASGSTPLAPTLSRSNPVAGGSLLAWEHDGSDLAGYCVRLYRCPSPGSYQPLAGWLEENLLSLQQMHLPKSSGADCFTVSAVGISGNESLQSPYIDIEYGEGDAHPQLVLLDKPGSASDLPIQISVHGDGLVWSFDTDSDGSPEITGSNGTESILPATAGLQRITATGWLNSEILAIQTLSYLSTEPGARPPVANASVSPQSGVVPLEVSLQGSASDPDNDIALYRWDYEGDGYYDYSSSDQPNPSPVEYHLSGNWQPLFRVEDSQGLHDSVQLQVAAQQEAGEQAPVARITADPRFGSGELNVTLDASESFDDGSIVNYEWKRDVNDEEWIPGGSSPTIQLSFSWGRTYQTPCVRVTDDDGLQDASFTSILVDRGWEDPVTIDDTLDHTVFDYWQAGGGYPKIAFVSGGDVYRVQASDTHGFAWDSPELVNDDGNAGNVAIAGEHVVHWDSQSQTLHKNYNVGGNWIKAVIASGSDYGQFLDMDMKDVVPHLCYYDADAGDLYVADLVTHDGPVDNHLIDSSGDVGSYCSIISPEGAPDDWWVAYYDATNTALKFVSQEDGGDLYDALVPLTLDNSGDVGMYASVSASARNYFISEAEWFPAISYYDATNGNLKYIQSVQLNATPSIWCAPLVLDSDGDVGRGCELYIGFSGHGYEQVPLIVYYDDTNGSMKYVRSLWVATEEQQYWAEPMLLRSGQLPFRGDLRSHSLQFYPSIVTEDNGVLQHHRHPFSDLFEP